MAAVDVDATDRASRALSPLGLVVWAGIVLGTLWLVQFGGTVTGIYLPEFRVVTMVVAAVALVAWAVAAARDARWRARSAIWPALAAPLAAFAITTVLSGRLRVSVEYLAYAIVLAALYLLLRALLTHPAFRSRIGGLVVILAAGIGLAYVAACTVRWIEWWGVVGAVRLPPLRPSYEGLTFGNPMAVMTMSVLFTAAAAAHLGLATPARRLATASLVVLAGVVTLLSGTRGGWLAVAAALVVTGLLAVVGPVGRRAIAKVTGTRSARLGLVAIAIIGMVAAAVLAPGILLRAGAGGEELRAAYLAVATRMFMAAPVTGTGAGTWVANRIAFTADTEPDYYIPHAHNLYAQTAAEHGLLGIVAGLLVVVCLGWLIAGAVRDVDQVRRRWGWAALFAAMYFGAHNLLDFYANMPAALFALAVPIAWLDATAPRSITAGLPAALRVPSIGRWTRRAVGAAGVVVVGVAIAGLLAQEVPARAMSAGWAAAGRGDWAAALPDFRAANDADPGIPAYALGRGLAEARAGDPATALATLEGVAASEDLPVAWIDVAALRLAAGDATGARDAVDRGLRLGDQQPAILFAAGALLESLGDLPGADASWSASLRAMPSLAGDPWWLDPRRADRWPAIREAALAEMPSESAADLWLSAGDTEQAATVATTIADAVARERTQLAIAAWDGNEKSRRALETFATDHPFDLVAVAWAARVAGRTGDLDAVNRYRIWGDVVNAGNFGWGGDVRVRESAATGFQTGLNGLYWGQYTFRRPSPSEQLVPDLPQLIVTP